MRRLLTITALLLTSPALAGPLDVWTIDQRTSSLAFTATQVGSFVNGKFPTWSGEIVLDPTALAVARIENHYVRHLAFLEDGELLRGVGRFRKVPGVIIHGRYDMIAPIEGAFALARAWPEAAFTLAEGESHDIGDPGIRRALLEATDRFANLD